MIIDTSGARGIAAGRVSRRKRLLSLIEDGSLQVIRRGPRLLLIRTEDALWFETTGGTT
jgi:hypothetical protein